MFQKKLAKIDKFYVAFSIVLSLLAILIIVTFRNVFSAFIVSFGVDTGDEVSSVKVDEEKLDEAYKFAFENEKTPLNLR